MSECVCEVIRSNVTISLSWKSLTASSCPWNQPHRPFAGDLNKRLTLQAVRRGRNVYSRTFAESTRRKVREACLDYRREIIAD